jgi:hypothetical protein
MRTRVAVMWRAADEAARHLAATKRQLSDITGELKAERFKVGMLTAEGADKDLQIEACGRSQLFDLVDRQAQVSHLHTSGTSF